MSGGAGGPGLYLLLKSTSNYTCPWHFLYEKNSCVLVDISAKGKRIKKKFFLVVGPIRGGGG